jgi:hypothetical protein
MALIDRFKKLLESPQVQAFEHCQRALEEVMWQGSPGSPEPSLLEEELRLVRQRRGDGSPAGLLVLCVGYSPEPLLLAVAHHAPAEVVLLVETNLDQRYLATFAELWDSQRDLLHLPPFSNVERRTVRDNPAEVYQTVRALAEQRSGRRIVVDITGAKKSMIAGAFLAAGFLDLETSYVDFEQYNPALRRPVPGTSRPGRLEHPYQLFRLREEARLREELDRRRFREAERLARELQAMATSQAILERQEAQALAWRFETVGRAAGAYALWSEGFYNEAAAELAACPTLPVPPQVALLAPIWPRSDQPAAEIVKALSPPNVFKDPANALAYFLDVLVWNTEEEIGGRPRDCFLRLYGTVESVLSFAFHVFVSRRPERLCVAVRDPEELAQFGQRCPRADPTSWEHLLHAIALDAGEKSSAVALKVLAGKTVRIQPPPSWKGLSTEALEAFPSSTAELAGAVFAQDILALFEGKDDQIRLRTFSELRHKAVHWLAPVPRESAASLLSYYRLVLQKIVPPAAAHLQEDAPELSPEARQRLGAWEERLLEAAAGRIPADCMPLLYGDVERLAPGTGRG